MTRDEIIEAAWKSGVWIPAGQGHAREQEIDRLERFAHLVAAAEREACAKAAETCFVGWPMDGGEQRHVCARAIRARGDA